MPSAETQASYIAMSTIRMEPVYMMLGESAGVAASMALRQQVAVQEIDVARLQDRLRAVGQILATPQVGKPADAR